MSAATTPAGRWSATLLPTPRPTPRPPWDGVWEADPLRIPAGNGRTLVAGGVVRAGILTWAIPTLPPVS